MWSRSNVMEFEYVGPAAEEEMASEAKRDAVSGGEDKGFRRANASPPLGRQSHDREGVMEWAKFQQQPPWRLRPDRIAVWRRL